MKESQGQSEREGRSTECRGVVSLNFGVECRDTEEAGEAVKGEGREGWQTHEEGGERGGAEEEKGGSRSEAAQTQRRCVTLWA